MGCDYNMFLPKTISPDVLILWLCCVCVQPTCWGSSSAVIYSTIAPPVSTSTTEDIIHAPQELHYQEFVFLSVDVSTCVENSGTWRDEKTKTKRKLSKRWTLTVFLVLLAKRAYLHQGPAPFFIKMWFDKNNFNKPIQSCPTLNLSKGVRSVTWSLPFWLQKTGSPCLLSQEETGLQEAWTFTAPSAQRQSGLRTWLQLLGL